MTQTTPPRVQGSSPSHFLPEIAGSRTLGNVLRLIWEGRYSGKVSCSIHGKFFDVLSFFEARHDQILMLISRLSSLAPFLTQTPTVPLVMSLEQRRRLPLSKGSSVKLSFPPPQGGQITFSGCPWTHLLSVTGRSLGLQRLCLSPSEAVSVKPTAEMVFSEAPPKSRKRSRRWFHLLSPCKLEQRASALQGDT